MDLAILELPMALFTTLAPMAAGAFIGLAIAFLTTPFSKERLARIDRLTPIPVVIFAVAWVIAFVFFLVISARSFPCSGPRSRTHAIYGADEHRVYYAGRCLLDHCHDRQAARSS